MPLPVLAQSTVGHDGAESPSPLPANGQNVSETAAGDIVVTGTLLRGLAPVGTNLIGIAPAEIAATGATNTNQLLTAIPQVSGFNDLPNIIAGTNSQSTVNRPRLRNIGSPYSGGSATLVLLDGHRVVGAGIAQTTPDPDIIPPGVIERVEIIPDGGSSTYGADAVAGVINFITRRRFSGIEADARFGFADNYAQVDAFVTAGKAWDTGSAYVSYNYAWNDSLVGGDRDYVRRLNWATNQPFDVTCNPGNITLRTAAGTALSYALPGRVLGSVNRCDESDYKTFYPEIKRHTAFVGSRRISATP